MGTFKQFISETLSAKSEEEKDIHDTISKLPKLHQKLLHGYKFKFQGGNTLKGDNQHIGYMDKEPKVIGVAAPWFYSREFTMLHEIGHIIWEELMTPQLRVLWALIVKATPNRQDQSPEELFSMAYACHYAKYCNGVHDHPKWHLFMKKFVPNE